MNAQRDDNFRAVGLAQTDGVTPATAPLLMDPVTGRLEVVQIVVTDIGGILPTEKRDDNHIPVAYGQADDGTGNLIPIAFDHRNGLLYVDIVLT